MLKFYIFLTKGIPQYSDHPIITLYRIAVSQPLHRFFSGTEDNDSVISTLRLQHPVQFLFSLHIGFLIVKLDPYFLWNLVKRNDLLTDQLGLLVF